MRKQTKYQPHVPNTQYCFVDSLSEEVIMIVSWLLNISHTSTINALDKDGCFRLFYFLEYLIDETSLSW